MYQEDPKKLEPDYKQNVNPITRTPNAKNAYFQTNTPPVKINDNDYLDLSIFDEMPEAKLCDITLNKIRTARAFQLWAFRMKRIKLSKERDKNMKSRFEIPDDLFDVSDRLAEMKYERKKQKQEIALQRYQIIGQALEKHKLLSLFNKWRKKVGASLSQSFENSIEESSQMYEGYSVQELIGEMHSLIQKNAEYITINETKLNQIDEVSTIIANSESKLDITKKKLIKQTEEYNRLSNLMESSRKKYEDGIANLRMNIATAKDEAIERVSEARRRLIQSNAAKSVNAAINQESMEAIQTKIAIIKEKLHESRETALMTRYNILQAKKEIDNEEESLRQITAQRNQLATAVAKLQEQAGVPPPDIIEKLYKEREETEKEIERTKEQRKKNQALLQDLEAKQHVLDKKLQNAKRLEQLAMYADSMDTDDDEI